MKVLLLALGLVVMFMSGLAQLQFAINYFRATEKREKSAACWGVIFSFIFLAYVAWSFVLIWRMK